MLRMPNRNTLKYLGVAGAALVLIGVTYWPAQGQIRELEAEKQYWQGQQGRNPLKTQAAQLPHLLDLPSIIEQCQGLFQERQVQVLSINLERLGEDSAEATGSAGSAGSEQKPAQTPPPDDDDAPSPQIDDREVDNET